MQQPNLYPNVPPPQQTYANNALQLQYADAAAMQPAIPAMAMPVMATTPDTRLVYTRERLEQVPNYQAPPNWPDPWNCNS